MTQSTNPPLARTVAELARRKGHIRPASRQVPEETPVAFSYGGSTHAVMMATPADFDDFATGFSLTEGIITDPAEIENIETVETPEGYDLQIILRDESHDALVTRRRHMAGPVGCGLCGIESLEQAVRQTPSVAAARLSLTPDDITQAVALLNTRQPLHAETRAVHGAGFFAPDEGLVAVREDVGRHNALDKLAGAAARQGYKGATGAVVVTSRVSVEMVQKTAILGSPFIIAISAPTALAIRTAEKAGMTLVALVRGEDFEVFTHADRICAEGNQPRAVRPTERTSHVA
ncbi:formate dehydrogenase family accessory protein FdhD [Rhizobium sp. Leaf384]|uniref:formate dehydrogenase accessory sulfurtransferase FdhD n=1 Tax=unclassified Rhizobium TaxID=2613769 RepID=UPI0007141585|nr:MULTISPECIES: formate dehydrogenase accessory sulfurtransferase FdhD [unclassified Rhizobium]KQS76357.1 formate dehydrogenase family accessory protein FdhD [Rhizobium sp. Leaf384]KQS78622.1 formate dehydrogenase family accessory protein FdhD [Rhizobium sp. Leaf383]